VVASTSNVESRKFVKGIRNGGEPFARKTG
jgi:hypothetical protein